MAGANVLLASSAVSSGESNLELSVSHQGLLYLYLADFSLCVDLFSLLMSSL